MLIAPVMVWYVLNMFLLVQSKKTYEINMLTFQNT
jgi:hypothetical protein